MDGGRAGAFPRHFLGTRGAWRRTRRKLPARNSQTVMKSSAIVGVGHVGKYSTWFLLLFKQELNLG